jgi:hypothetical protein
VTGVYVVAGTCYNGFMSEQVSGYIEVQVFATAYVEDGRVTRVVVQPDLDLDFAHRVTVTRDGVEYAYDENLGVATIDGGDVAESSAIHNLVRSEVGKIRWADASPALEWVVGDRP